LLNGSAALDVMTHEAAAGRVGAALDEIAKLDEVHGRPELLGVVGERGV
jgi:hypothetical protein